jgi:hypothetical protein
VEKLSLKYGRKFRNALKVILIRKNQEKKVNEKTAVPKVQRKARKKMPVFHCPCGIKILIVPDLPEMNKAIENHMVEHKKITRQDLSEEFLAQEILIAIAEA